MQSEEWEKTVYTAAVLDKFWKPTLVLSLGQLIVMFIGSLGQGHLESLQLGKTRTFVCNTCYIRIHMCLYCYVPLVTNTTAVREGVLPLCGGEALFSTWA